MIYIIGGASRSGKSLIAKNLSIKLNLSYLGTDSLMMGFMHGIPEIGIHDKLWPNEIAVKMWPFINALISNMLYNNIDFIIEGEALLPQDISQLMVNHPSQVKACFVGYEEVDLNQKVSDVKEYINHENDWMALMSDDLIYDHIKNMKSYSLDIRNQCEENDIMYFNLSKNFKHCVNEVIDYLTQH